MKDVSDFKRHIENVKKVGGLGHKIKYDRIGREYKCSSCGGELVPGVFTCDGIKFDDFGVRDVCARCHAGIGHPAFQCSHCLKFYKGEDIIGNKKHFFMNSKIKVGS